MTIIRRMFIIAVALPFMMFAQGVDELMFRSAMSASSDSGKLGGLNRLIAAFPQSRFISDAHGARFSVLMSLHQDSGAFAAAHAFLASKDSLSLPGALHYLAMELGYRKKYSDSALVFLDSAITLYQRHHGRTEPIMLHTKAMHLFLLKKFAAAETTQLEAIAMLPAAAEYDARYNNYYTQLGSIQLEINPGIMGLEPFVRASFISTQPMPDNTKLDSLFHSRIRNTAEETRVRDSLFGLVAADYIRNAEDSSRAKGFTAASFARNRVLPGLALHLAKQAYQEVAGRPLRDRSGVVAQLGLVLYSAGKYEEAEKMLTEASQTASPYETELFLTLGAAQEKLGRKHDAFSSYLSGVTVTRPPILMKPLQALHKELYPHTSLDSMIAVAQRKLVDFFPDKYNRPESAEDVENPRVVVAELFTGSECRPCQATDIAYDKLLQRYDRSVLAVLEYHLHIPRPDPMSNDDAEARAAYYKVNSTPTSIIDGTLFIPGGGPSIAAKSIYSTHVEAVEKRLGASAEATIRVSARIRKNKISLAVTAVVKKAKKGMRLRVALLEDGLRYQGSNGISDHRFVVRKMIRGAAGTAFTQNGKAAVKDAFAVSAIENSLEKYLGAYEAKNQKQGGSFKEKKSEIDPKQLYVIAFVQDDATRSILQSTFLKVKR